MPGVVQGLGTEGPPWGHLETVRDKITSPFVRACGCGREGGAWAGRVFGGCLWSALAGYGPGICLALCVEELLPIVATHPLVPTCPSWL